jgi:hypothetical protein
MKIKQALSPLPITIIYYCAKFLMCFLFFFFKFGICLLSRKQNPKKKQTKNMHHFWVGGGAPDDWQLANCDDLKFCGM